MDLALTGQRVLVAGSSRGIGLAIARGFAQEGARVIITGRNAETLAVARQALVAETGGEVLALSGDMTDAADIRRIVAESVAAFGALDTVVANVGTGAVRPGYALEPADWDRALQANLYGAMTLAAQVLPDLVARRSGSLTFISSIAGVEAIGAPVSYSAAKAALHLAMKAMARQVGPHGVRVNAIAPGNILFPGGSWERKLAERREFFEAYVQAEVPLQRFGRPEEIADMAVFLASPRAGFITGAVMVVDGGQTRSTA